MEGLAQPYVGTSVVGYWRCYDPPLWALKERAAVRTGRIWCSNRIYPPCTQNGASSCHSLPRNNNIAAQLIKACRWGSNCCTWVHDRAATLNEGRSVANLTCLWAPHIERVRLYVSGVQRTQLVTWQSSMRVSMCERVVREVAFKLLKTPSWVGST